MLDEHTRKRPREAAMNAMPLIHQQMFADRRASFEAAASRRRFRISRRAARAELAAAAPTATAVARQVPVSVCTVA
jgi:hypothetical protein